MFKLMDKLILLHKKLCCTLLSHVLTGTNPCINQAIDAQLFYFTYTRSRAVTKIDVINSNIPSTHSGVSGLQRVKIVI